VFGVHSVCRAIELEKTDFQAVRDMAVQMMQNETGSFKVEARRSDKRFPMDSPAINADIGGYVLERVPALTVDVHRPQHLLSVEIRDKVYLYTKPIPGVGGMPVGTNGRATVLLSGGIDSPVAAWMVAKRGVSMSAVHFQSPPYTSERARDKVVKLAQLLSESLCGIRLHLVPFTDIQMQIHEKCHPDYTTLIMRRYMMRIAARIAHAERAQALVTGESIGQVASQTMHALQCTDAVADMPVFRPLIGFDKQEIITLAEKIGTFETSSLPYEDCCTVFTPKHPATKPKMEIILEGEAKLDSDALVEAALAGREILEL
jgi:thiamine biosynthesis protein ThiI